jgi:hypothetical protein
MSFICIPCVACWLRIKTLEQTYPGTEWTEKYSCGQG